MEFQTPERKAYNTARQMIVAALETGQPDRARSILTEINAAGFADEAQRLRHEMVQAYGTDLT